MRALAIWVVLCSACESATPPARSSDARPHVTASAHLEPRRRWGFVDRVSSLTVVGEIAPSQHLDGRRAASLHTSAPELYPDRPMPEGTLVVESLQTADGAVLFAMVKQPTGWFPAGGDWSYAIVLPDGMVESEGRLEGCARCHAEAPSQRLFGLPRGK